MGIVADGAGSLITRVIPMRLSKRSLTDIMTAQTKRILCLHQKIFLVRTVREMAGRTALCTYFVDHFLFIILLTMTLKARFAPFCFQQVIELRSMGIVTLDALSPL
jgi:hypothetical protein